jgi:hypothetical protein
MAAKELATQKARRLDVGEGKLRGALGEESFWAKAVCARKCVVDE